MERVLIGDGPDLDRVKALARGAPNIRILDFQPTDVLADYMARARAFVFAAEEDFGITPVEAQACGTPVIAYGAGGALETVVSSDDPHARTGVFFHRQSADAICKAVREFEAQGTFLSQVCRANGERFSVSNFQRRLRQALGGMIAGHCGEGGEGKRYS